MKVAAIAETSEDRPGRYTRAVILHRKRTIAAVVSGALFVLACEESPLAPVVPEGEGIVIYRDINFQAAAQAFNSDQKDLDAVDGACRRDDGENSTPNWGDCISSVRVNPGWMATFYVDDSWRGPSFTASEDVSNFNTISGPCRGGGFNDCISSIRISKVR
jgi:hypothetical protein